MYVCMCMMTLTGVGDDDGDVLCYWCDKPIHCDNVLIEFV